MLMAKSHIFVFMVTTKEIAPKTLKEARLRSRHKQSTLAAALRCSTSTVANFECGRTQRMYAVDWETLARELGLKRAA
jgi:transcriptional regulator with XRE-family HTH domain